MNSKRWMVGTAAVVCSCSALVWAMQPDLDSVRDQWRDKKDQVQQDAQDMIADGMPEEAKKWIEAGTPGKHHEHLAQLVGTWKAQNTMWMEPGAPAMESSGTHENTMLMDGRFLHTTYKGDFMGMPFNGTAYWGFNNVSGKYESVWMDSVSTGMMTEQGMCNGSGDVITMRGVYHDPTKGKVKTKTVTKVVDDDTYTMTMYTVNPDGSEFKHMHMINTRVN